MDRRGGGGRHRNRALASTLMRWLSVMVMVLLGVGCSYRAAPPEERRPSPRYEPAAPTSTRIQRPSHYTVKRGDTLYAIAWRYGLDYRDLARWNRVSAPFVIHPDQALRLYPPRRLVAAGSKPQADGAASTSPVTAQAASVSVRPITTSEPSSIPTGSPVRMPVTNSDSGARPPAPQQQPVKQPAAKPAGKPARQPAKPVAASPATPVWRWPLRGQVLSEFSNASPNLQGLDIAAAEGATVTAAAAGEVVYSGSGLVGYGELVIIKHSARYLSAYAHNRQRFVKEGQQVAQGDKIAEVGGNGGQKSRLHFQIRENGKPVDPRRFLP